MEVAQMILSVTEAEIAYVQIPVTILSSLTKQNLAADFKIV